MINPTIENDLKHMSLNDINYADYIKENYVPIEELKEIRQEIEEKYSDCDICEWFEDYDYEENNISEYRSVGSIKDIFEIFDKHIKEYSK